MTSNDNKESQGKPDIKPTGSIGAKTRSILDHLQFSYRLTLWHWRQRFRFVVFQVHRHSALIKRILILAASLLLARFVVASIDVSEFPSDHLANYFVAIGAMVGGIIAIVFSISIFAQQSASDLSSSGYFEEYTRGWNEKLIYLLVVVISILFFGLGLIFNGKEIGSEWKEISIYVSLFLIGSVFVLIDAHYQSVSRKLSPLKAILFLEEKAIKFLNETHKDAQRISKILKAKQKEARVGLALAAAYNGYLQPHLKNLDRQIENLFEISMKLSARQEIMTTNRGLTAIFDVLNNYLDVRKTSSVALLSSISFFTFESDSQSFLTKSFERLNNSGEKFIRDGKTENATHIVQIYRALAVKSSEIAFTERYHENPIFNQITGYLGFYLKFARQEKNLDVVLSGARTFSNLSMVALQNNLQSSLSGIQRNLYESAVFGITSKATFISDECVKGWQQVLTGVFYQNFFNARHEVSETMENMGRITQLLHTAITTGYLPADFTTQMSLTKPYDEMYSLLTDVLNFYFGSLKEESDKKHFRDNLIVLFEEICRNIRYVSEHIPLLDNSLTMSIGNLLFNLNSTIIQLLDDKGFADVNEELRKRLSWNIHLPSFLFHDSDSFKAGRLESLTESIAKTGILLFRRKDADDLIVDCVESLHWIVKKGIEKCKEGYGYDEPRAMLKICYLGVLALKLNKQAILTEVGVRIYEFEEQFKAKYFSNLPPGIDPDKGNVIGLPRRDQLFLEIFHWRDEFRSEKYRSHRIMDDAQNMMYDFIDEIDIDWFMFEVWGSFPASSPIEKEIEERFTKRKEIARLAGLLGSMASKKVNGT